MRLSCRILSEICSEYLPDMFQVCSEYVLETVRRDSIGLEHLFFYCSSLFRLTRNFFRLSLSVIVRNLNDQPWFFSAVCLRPIRLSQRRQLLRQDGTLPADLYRLIITLCDHYRLIITDMFIFLIV